MFCFTPAIACQKQMGQIHKSLSDISWCILRDLHGSGVNGKHSQVSSL